MPIFQTIADYEKWRRRELRKKLLARAAEDSVVTIASEAGGPTAFYERYGKYRPAEILKGTKRNNQTTGGGNDSGKNTKNPKNGPIKGKSPSQRTSIADSPTFESVYGGFTYSAPSPGWDVSDPNFALSDGTFAATEVANAEPALAGATGPQYGVSTGIWYIEFYVTGDLTGCNNLMFGVCGDTNGSGAGSATTARNVGVGYVVGTDSWRMHYSSGGTALQANANGAVPSYDPAGTRIGVAFDMDSPYKIWGHVNGIWLSSASGGGDPDDGGVGYTNGSTGTLWNVPYVRAAAGLQAGVKVRVVTPIYAPNAADTIM